MSLVHNEQTKLTATYLNGVAIALFAVGGLAPIVAALSLSMPPAPLPVALVLSLVCNGASVILHSLARRALNGLKP